MRPETTQPQYPRDGLRYASDVTDAKWGLIEALLQPPRKSGDCGAQNAVWRVRQALFGHRLRVDPAERLMRVLLLTSYYNDRSFKWLIVGVAAWSVN